MIFTCKVCGDEISSEEGFLAAYDVDLEIHGFCESCARAKAYCAEHDGFSFEEADLKSISECNMCDECAGNWFSEPQSDDPDFWDSYDPDMDR